MDKKRTLLERAAAWGVAVSMLVSMMPVQVFAEEAATDEPAATTSVTQQTDTPATQQGSTSGAQQSSTPATQQSNAPAAQQSSTPAAQQSSTPAAQQSNALAAPNGGTPELRSTAVSAVTLDENSCNLEVGESKTLVAKVTPEDAPQDVTWASNNNTVVTVNGGMITAHAEGTATITVEKDGLTRTYTVSFVAPQENNAGGIVVYVVTSVVIVAAAAAIVVVLVRKRRV